MAKKIENEFVEESSKGINPTKMFENNQFTAYKFGDSFGFVPKEKNGKAFMCSFEFGKQPNCVGGDPTQVKNAVTDYADFLVRTYAEQSNTKKR